MSSTNIINPNLVPITVGLESTGILEKMHILSIFKTKKHIWKNRSNNAFLIFHK
jgi:hypothetical protein